MAVAQSRFAVASAAVIRRCTGNEMTEESVCTRLPRREQTLGSAANIYLPLSLFVCVAEMLL